VIPAAVAEVVVSAAAAVQREVTDV
jgi:hypothetical protein